MFYHSKMLTRLLQASREATHGYNVIIASVSGLLLLCSPSTVLLAVVALFVWIAVQSFSLWSNAHVLQKVIKRIQPSLANSYAFSAVTLIALSLWIGAALNHVNPSSMSWRSAKTVGSKSAPGNFSMVFGPRVWFVFGRHNVGSFNVVFSSVAGIGPGAHCDCFNEYRSIHQA